MIYVQSFLRPEGIGGKEKYCLEHEAGLRLLSLALKDARGIQIENIHEQIARDERGKPCLPAFPEVYFNISHSWEMAVCALGNSPVGADVERIRQINVKLIRRILTDREKAFLETCPPKQQNLEFFRIWSLKESLGKALGVGLGLDFRQAEFLLSPWKKEESGKLVELDGVEWMDGRAEKEEWRFFQTVWEEEYVISCCTKEREEKLVRIS